MLRGHDETPKNEYAGISQRGSSTLRTKCAESHRSLFASPAEAADPREHTRRFPRGKAHELQKLFSFPIAH